MVGTLYQEHVALDPYIIAEKYDRDTKTITRACLGIWDGDQIIAIAKQSCAQRRPARSGRPPSADRRGTGGCTSSRAGRINRNPNRDVAKSYPRSAIFIPPGRIGIVAVEAGASIDDIRRGVAIHVAPHHVRPADNGKRRNPCL
jgi:hypothetical protein